MRVEMRDAGLTLSIRHTRQRSRHELQAAFPRLLWLLHLSDVEDVEEPAGHRDDQVVPDEVHEVDAFRLLVRGNLRCGGSWIPEADSAIPGARDQSIWSDVSAGEQIARKSVRTGVLRIVHAGNGVIVLSQVVYLFGLQLQPVSLSSAVSRI